jgi:predicted NBD/HSP70 family sugar kinase
VKRNQFEHIIAAAANVLSDDEVVVIGSQAILGSTSAVPDSMLVSMEADIDPARHPERAIEVDGALRDRSPFHRQFGYYAHGVGPETAKAPAG